jgi:hypothetical protein
MTSRQKCQTSDAIDFDPPKPNSIEHPPPQTVRTGLLHRMLVAHPLLLLLTTEARRAQRNFIFCPIGRRRSGKRTQPFGQVLENQLGSGNIWCSAKGASAEGGGSFPWPPSPGQGKNHPLCVLCVSVVHFPSVSSTITSVCELIHQRGILPLATFPGLQKAQSL